MKRHICSYCSKKRNEDKMIKIYYHLLHRSAWHCRDCYLKRKLSSEVDI